MMRSEHRDRLLLVPALLCALLGTARTRATASGRAATRHQRRRWRGCTRTRRWPRERYEAGRREAEAQRPQADAAARRCSTRERQRDRRAARGPRRDRPRPVPHRRRARRSPRRCCSPTNPEELMRGQRLVWQADLAVNNAARPRAGGPRRGSPRTRRRPRRPGATLERRETRARRAEAGHRGEAGRGAVDSCRGRPTPPSRRAPAGAPSGSDQPAGAARAGVGHAGGDVRTVRGVRQRR